MEELYMEKVFEDFFSELQADMVSICLEYVEERAEKIYIYCSFESRVIANDFFYKINGKIVKKHKLNDVLVKGQKEYDVSVIRQKSVLKIINDNIMALIKLCQEYQREMPTQIKLVYDITTGKLNADYSYNLVYSNDETRTADDVLEEWYRLEKSEEE